MSLKIKTINPVKDVYIIAPVGPISYDTYPVLEKETQRVIKKSPVKVVLDMTGVDYISSMGIRVILAALKALNTIKGELVLVNLQPQIKKVFEIINAMPSVQIFENIAEMDRYLDAMQRQALAGDEDE
ncbi:MAG: STAS domain-containing protein [Thermodesulfobacteriota bacterium]